MQYLVLGGILLNLRILSLGSMSEVLRFLNRVPFLIIFVSGNKFSCTFCELRPPPRDDYIFIFLSFGSND